MTLYELQRVLGERIEKVQDRTLTAEEKREELEISDIIARLAKQMINNADIILRTDKLISEGKLNNSTIAKVVGENERS